MIMIIFFLLLCHSSLASFYNEACTNKCDLSGLICSNQRCICDSQNRLFWTGARCAPCPNDWTMTETVCLTYFDSPMPWESAKLTCRDFQAELMSFRSQNLIPPIYAASSKKMSVGAVPKYSGWTSAHATNPTELGKYQWLDSSVASFDSKSSLWCQRTTSNLGYNNIYDEPTRQSQNNEFEACVVYLRGTTSTGPICLDDRFCSQPLPFICEKSESTSIQYLGPAPKTANHVNMTNSGGATVIHTVPSNVGTVIINTGPRALNSDKSMAPVAIGLFFVLLVLLLLFGGVFFYIKRRNSGKTQQFQTKDIISDHTATRTSKGKTTDTDDPVIKEESISSDANTSEVDLAAENEPAPVTTIPPIGLSKSSKNKRGGYSKQQFDEFE